MTKRKRTKRLQPKKQLKKVERSSPITHSDIVCFLTYSVGCIALQKITTELTDLWLGDEEKWAAFDQNQFQLALKEPWKVIVLHRGGTHGWNDQQTPALMTLLKDRKEKGTRLVYYIDDFLVHLNNNVPLHLMKMCDTVIAKGYFLPKYLKESEGLTNVEELKTWINLEKFDDPKITPYEFNRPFNVIWFSAGRTGLGLMPNIFEKLDPKDWQDTYFHIIGTNAAIFRSKLNRFRGFNKVYSEKVPLEGLYQLAKGCNFIINPLHNETDNDDLSKLPIHRRWFNDSKVEIKYIVSGAASKPLVTSNALAYEKCIDQGINGYIVNTPEAWADIMLKLKRDKVLCEKIGKAARADVEKNYDAKDRWSRIKELVLGK